jgi:hypothetical protein
MTDGAGGNGHVAAADLAARAVAAVLGDLGGLDGRGQRGVVVDSPPGAGKSALVVRAAAELAAAGEPVMVVAQTNGQVDDLVGRLATAAAGTAIGRLSALDYQPAPQLSQYPGVIVAQRVRDLAGCPIMAGTAAKWATVGDGSWPWAIIDEAYQMRSDMLIRIAGRFDRALFVGDPGQLDPFSTIEIDPVDRPELGSHAERRGGAAAQQPRPADPPAAGLLAAARLGCAGGSRGVLSVHRLPGGHRAR